MTQNSNIKPGYKKTPIGIIPEDWEVKRIKQFAPLQRGFDLPVAKIVEGRYPVVFSNGISKFHSDFKAVGPGVVTGRSGTLGKVTFVEENYWPHNTTLWVTDFNDNDVKFVYYFYLNFKLERYGGGSGVPTLNRNDVHSQKIPIPPLPEQKSIANCLSTWDSGIEKLTQLIQAKKQQKKGLMQQLLTGSLRLRSASGEKFDGEWKEVRLGEIGETFNGLTGKTKDDFGEGSPYVSYLNVFNNSSITKETNFDFVKIKQGENQTQLKYGDLIFTTSSETPNEVGMSGVILFHPKDNLFLNSFCFGLRLKDFEELEPKFAVYLLRGKQFRRKMYKLAQGSTRFNLSKAGFRKITLIAPPVEEQTAIAEVLQTADKEIELLEQKLAAFQQQKKGLMQVLLTGERRLKN